MGIYTKYFLQAFLFFIGAMLLGYLLEILLADKIFEWSRVLSSLIGAVIISFGYTYYYKNRLVGEDIELFEDGDIYVEQKKVRSSLSPEQLLERIKSHPKTEKMKARLRDDNLIVSPKNTFQTWGYNLKIESNKIDDKNYEYTIISKNISQFMTLLWGSNLKNIKKISAVFEG